MNFCTRRGFIAACSCALALFISGSGASAAITWAVESDFSATSTPTSQARSLRGLALSDDETKLFGGFIQGTSSSAVKRIDVASGGVDTSLTIANSRQPNAIATDDRGYVYAAASVPTGSPDGQFRIYDSNLALQNTTTPAGTQRLAGLSVWKNGSSYYLYLAREATSSALIQRYLVDNVTAPVLDLSFGTGGSFDVRSIDATAFNLTGLEVAADGTIYATDRDKNSLFKISADLSTTQQVTVNRAMDVALYNGDVYVTQYDSNNSAIRVLKQSDLSLQGVLTTGIARDNVTDSGYAGIDVTADGRLFVVDQVYSNTPSSTFKDRILVSTVVPEPASLGLLVLGGCLLAKRRDRH
jgi:hypothetical protein